MFEKPINQAEYSLLYNFTSIKIDHIDSSNLTFYYSLTVKRNFYYFFISLYQNYFLKFRDQEEEFLCRNNHKKIPMIKHS